MSKKQEVINIIGSGSLDTLKSGEVILLQGRKIINDKVQLEFAEKLNTGLAGKRKRTAVALLNSSDPNFSSGAQRGYTSTVKADVLEHMGIDLGDDNKNWEITASRNGEEQETITLNILNPVTKDGDIFKLEITETVEPTEWQKINAKTACKTAGKGGAEITHEGQLIFRNSAVVILDPNDPEDVVEHILLKPDPRNIAFTGEMSMLSEEVIDFEEVMEVDEK